jgi:two-component system CheB/CheR fusion protein
MTPVYEPRAQNVVLARPSSIALAFSAESVGFLNGLIHGIGASGFVVDEANIVKYCFGGIEKHFKGKLFTLYVGDVLPQKSMDVFNAAAFKCVSTGRKTVVKDFLIGRQSSVELILVPFSQGGRQFVVAIFNFKKKSRQSPAYFAQQDFSEYTQHLEQEVKNLKFQLDNFHQEIEASKENLQSFNGELLSANEEMQSTNEEWQSVNEELQTINAQYQLRIKELTDLNDDLDNYFRSNVNAQLFVDSNLLLKKFSPSATKHIHLRPIDIGRPLNEITTQIKLSSFIDDIKSVIETGEVVSRNFKGENEMWYQLLTMPYIRQADNRRDGAIITIYDISGLKKIEQDLDDKNERLKKINADLDDFVYTASHDLIAPLTNIEALIEVLNGKIRSGADNTSEVIGLIQSAVERFKATIKDLSDIRKIESDMMKEPDRINFEQLTNEVRVSIQDQLEASGAVINTEFAESEIRFSRKSLRSIIFNLVSNAIKFSDPHRTPEIYLSTYRVPGFIVLMIKDNGVGIRSEKLDSIFTMFHSLPDTLQMRGLGLYLVKKITEASKGKIEVESIVDEGTIFRIFLPFDPHML